MLNQRLCNGVTLPGPSPDEAVFRLTHGWHILQATMCGQFQSLTFVAASLRLLPEQPRLGDELSSGAQVRETIKRDLRRISQNLVLVVFPFNSGREEQQAALRNWDLWGPMVRHLCCRSSPRQSVALAEPSLATSHCAVLRQAEGPTSPEP